MPYDIAHWTAEYILPFIIVVAVVVVVHELGHYLVARFFGVSIQAFSFGFGPELFGFNDRRGTRWRVALLPLGGYVSMRGGENIDRNLIPAEERETSFLWQKLHKRFLIVLAGPLANFLLAIFLLAGIFNQVGRPADPSIITVGDIREGSPAEQAGIKPGDVVTHLNNFPLIDFQQLANAVLSSEGKPFFLEVRRGDISLTLTVVPEITQTEGGKKYVIGLIRELPLNEKLSPLDATTTAINETWRIIALTGTEIGALVSGRGKAENIAGPVRIAQFAREASISGIAVQLTFIAILSISLGLVNLFPLPVLDGGHLLFYIIEGIRGKALSAQWQQRFLKFGFSCLMVLMVWVLFNDLSTLLF